MASGNRVEELESRVRDLEATVGGLTDELVESRERLQALEAEVEPDKDIIEGKPTTSSESGNGAEDGATDDEAEADTPQGDDVESGASDDIIVA